jgi:hypothetical protein
LSVWINFFRHFLVLSQQFFSIFFNHFSRIRIILKLLYKVLRLLTINAWQVSDILNQFFQKFGF